VLGNVTGAIINVDEFKVHENQDGSVDKTRTDLYLHFVDRRDHSIMEVTRVLNLVDQNIERLDKLFKVRQGLCTAISNILLKGQTQEFVQIQ
jgi:carbonic anhydrase